LAALPNAHWSAIAPNAPLRRWRLIEVRPGESLVTSQLRLDETVLHYLAGLPFQDERLQGIIEPLGHSEELAPAHLAIARDMAAIWSNKDQRAEMPFIQLCGDERGSTRGIVADACVALGLRMYCLPAEAIPVNASERDHLARLAERIAALGRGVLFVEAGEIDTVKSALIPFLEGIQSIVVISSRERITTNNRQIVYVEVERPKSIEQLELWRGSLGPLAAKLNGTLESIVSQFNLNSKAIREISLTIAGQGPKIPDHDIKSQIWEACRIQTRSHLDDLSMRIEAKAQWNDLVLPEAQQQILLEIAANVRQRFTLNETWGFARKSSRGLSIIALFSGASGTGKTMAAEVLANELKLDLLRIDLSRVVSKYIGETEKNLRRVFDTAERRGAVLFFDEADALFGKRSEVKDSHDRYANIEISYLLQRMEEYSGLAILATNMKDSLDAAFLRRIRFIVQFPFPDASQRAEIWRGVFPADTPTEKIDIKKLSGLSIAGGNIHNVAVYAAFIAADANEPVRMKHLARAAQVELTKLGRPLAPSEVEEWI